MTKQEAIEQLNIKKLDMEFCVGLIKQGNQFIPKQSTPLLQAIKIAIKALEQQEDIVHCKDCRLLVDDGYCKLHSYGVDWILYPDADTDFCSWGERGEK